MNKKKRLDFKTWLYLHITNTQVKNHMDISDVDKKRTLTIEKVNVNEVYIFKDYDEYRKFFLMYLNEISDEKIDEAIYIKGRKGHIVAFKALCDHIIVENKVNHFYNSITEDQIEEIHRKGKLTPLEVVQLWESHDLCVPGDHASSAKYRCDFFHNCHKCLMEFATHRLEHENFDFKPVNSSVEPTDSVETTVAQNINWDLIHKLREYDIVIVKKEEQQKGIFIIVQKEDEKKQFSGHYCTSNINERYFRKQKNKPIKMVLNKEHYHLRTHTLVLLQNNINLPYENVIHPLSHLRTVDKNRLNKYKSLLCHNTVISSPQNPVVEIADIIEENNIQYILYQVDHLYCYGYPIYESNDVVDLEKDHNYILIHPKLYFIDYQNKKAFDKNTTLYIVGRFDHDIVQAIRQNKKHIKFEARQKSKINQYPKQFDTE